MVAVGADDRLRESDGCVSPRPMKRRFQHNLFGWVALRLVESRGWLWFSEDVGDTVIANSIAGAEIAVRVVIEGAPSDTAGILRIRGQLIVDARMSDRVLGKPFDLVDGLGGIGVPAKFRVQIPRMVRRF